MKTYNEFISINEGFTEQFDFYKKIGIKSTKDFNKNNIIEDYFYNKKQGKLVGWTITSRGKDIILIIYEGSMAREFKFISTDFTIDTLNKKNAKKFTESFNSHGIEYV